MLSRYTHGCFSVVLALIMGTLLASCASSPTSSREVFFDSAMNDHNRAPASMSPPPNAGEASSSVDPLSMRTQADYYFSLGESYSLDGDHQKAVDAFKMVLVYDPNAAQVHLRLSAEYVKLGLVSEALTQAQLAVQKDPEFADAHLLLGGLYSTMKVYDKALTEYQTVIKLDPQNTEAPLYTGAVYAEQKKYDKAVKFFQELANNDNFTTPWVAYYYVGRVRSEQEGKKYEKEAEKAYQKAIGLKPDYLEGVLALGGVYTAEGHDDKAVTLYRNYQREYGPNVHVADILSRKYMEQEKYDLAYEQLQIIESYADDTLDAKMKMALILIEQKKYPDAIAKLKDVLRQVPESDKIRFYLAAVYEEINQPENAIEHFVKIPAGSQFYGEARVHAAYLYKEEKKLDDALSVAEDGIKARQDLPQLYTLYASLLDEKGNDKEAKKVLTTALEKFPDNVQLTFFMGTVQDRLGEKDQVVSTMKKVIEMDPNHVQGLNYLAFTYAESDKNLDDAEKLARRALQMQPNDGFILDTLGWVLYKKGDIKGSIRYLEAAVKNQPNESIIAEHLGDAYYKNQLVEKARQMYRHAAELETDQTKSKAILAKISALDRQQLPLSSDRKPASADEP
jgi:tetratricopeptide (TPR) repeat protein